MILKKLTILASISCFFLFAGCTKKTSSSSTASTFKYTIDGTPFSGVGLAQKSGTILNITGASTFSGTTATYPICILNILNFTGNKTYDIAKGEAGGSVAPNTTSSHAGYYGTITISSSSPNIVGTFQFTALDSSKITSGSFSVKAP